MKSEKHFAMKIFITLLLLIAGMPLWSQQFNNEWINYNQSYYKFQVGNSGVYRISKSKLDSVGIGNTNVQLFGLWRNGKQVRIYSPVSSGPLPNGGYLEFWGEMNDGVADKPLYIDSNFQHITKFSIITDTVSYFLTVNTSPSTFFYTDVPNNVAANTLPAEPYFMHSAGNYYRNKINSGFAAVIGEYVYSSSYDKGEFWTSSDIRPPSPLVHNLTNLYVDNSAPVSTITLSATGNALNTRSVKVNINGTDVKDTIMDYFNDLHARIPIATSLISSGNATVRFTNTSSISSDRMAVAFYQINYPRQFNFDNQKNFTFGLPAKSQGYYLEIANFSIGTTAPVLYNLSSGERYQGDISTPGLVKFALPGSSSNNEFVLVNTEPGNQTIINSLTTRNFLRFSDAVNQGKYLIISNPSLFIGTRGNNPVDEYKNYRASAEGGNFNAKIVDINEIVDQFAFGIKKHPLSIKNYLRYARSSWPSAPDFAFLMGRGMTYSDYRINENKPDVDKLNLVPSYGFPASDNMLSSDNGYSHVAVTPIGRLSVINGKEIEDYLEKVKEYEYVQKNAPNTIAGKAWMKNVVHVTGSSDPFLGTVLCNFMGVYKQIIEDTLFGAKVHTFCKTSTNPVEQLSNDRIQSLFSEGISVLTYFGHSSSTSLEFNLDNPYLYNNQGKYPVFFVNGCQAGNFYTYQPLRLVINETLSEKFVLAKQRGSVAFVASTHYGIVNYLNIFITHLYTLLGSDDYGITLGELNRDALQKLLNSAGSSDYYARIHAEEVTLHGDPALKLNVHPKPDYIIEEPQILINPTFISIAENSFKLDVKIKNIGKAVSDSVVTEIKRQYPDGTSEVIYRKKIRGIQYEESITLNVPIIATRDKGSNKITVTIDPDFSVGEISESNNTSTKEFFIFEDEARPIYPYNFAIINNNTQKLYASTANPFSIAKDYVLEVDTTELFNSSLKTNKTITSTGGLLEFTPGLTYRDSSVYYWRISLVPPAGTGYQWNGSSFVYLNNSSEGWNQSHYFQFNKNTYQNILLDSGRYFKFDTLSNHLIIKNILFPYGSKSSNFNGESFFEGGCGSLLNSLEFMVFDLKSGNYLVNPDGGAYGSLPGRCPDNGIRRKMLFNFFYNDPVWRKRAMDFLDSIPNESVIAMTNWGSQSFNSNPRFVDTWKSDTALYGSQNSIYHKLYNMGLNQIDSFYRNIPFLFVFKKNSDGTFSAVKQRVGNGPIDLVDDAVDFVSSRSSGNITSAIIGPAKKWKSIHWDGRFTENPSEDTIEVAVYGIKPDNTEELVYSSNEIKKDTVLDYISAGQYTFLRFKLTSTDKKNFTPYQLKYWQIKYDEMPEGGVEPKLNFTFKDSVEVGEPLDFSIAFKNISNTAFDSLKYKIIVTDANNVQQVIIPQKKRPLLKGDTVLVKYTLDTKSLSGRNTIFLDINPDNDQLEQYHFNNFIYRNLYVKADKVNPLLDVTFDGIHILNRDIVSSKPHIQIKLKDEAKFLLLNDTSLSSIEIRYPDGTSRTYNFDNDTLRFTPAANGTDNTATIDFFPVFSKQFNADGDEYELIAKGTDRSGNKAGEIEYRVTFKVVTKPMISNLLNYPNPFSTSTAFVFTLTGSEIPSNIKIQILTVTGKIVREITKDELGPIRIGRNITEFKWDGTDQYGQKLGNGVYLYRVVTTLNGRPMDKYKATGDNTDKYFNNGYGKMYLMR